jgi:hypothetical protein
VTTTPLRQHDDRHHDEAIGMVTAIADGRTQQVPAEFRQDGEANHDHGMLAHIPG